MTTATVPATRRPAQWRMALRYLAKSYLSLITLWFWSIALPVVAIIMAIVSRYTDISSSGIIYTQQGAIWFPFAIAIILATTYLGVHVGNGMTRRSFVQAILLSTAVVAVLNGTIMTLALLVEREVYRQIGWFHGRAGEEHGAVFDDGLLPYFLGVTLVFLAGQVSGSLVGIAYYRYGGWIGTLVLPLTLLPLLAVGTLGSAQSMQWGPWPWTDSLTWTGPALGLLVLAGGMVAFHRISRRVPISTERA